MDGLTADSHVPELEPRCNSWTVTRKATGEVIGEFFCRRKVARFDPAKCLIETTLQYLGRINQDILANNHQSGL